MLKPCIYKVTNRNNGAYKIDTTLHLDKVKAQYDGASFDFEVLHQLEGNYRSERYAQDKLDGIKYSVILRHTQKVVESLGMSESERNALYEEECEAIWS